MALILPRRNVYEITIDWEELFRRLKMAIYVPNASEVNQLKRIVNNTAPSDPVLRLYTSNTTPASGDTAGTYTEMSTQGYAAITLAGASFTFSTSDPSAANFAQQAWTFTGVGGATSVYGYFWTYTTGGTLILAERFSDGPYSIVNNGDQILITPIYQMQRV